MIKENSFPFFWQLPLVVCPISFTVGSLVKPPGPENFRTPFAYGTGGLFWKHEEVWTMFFNSLNNLQHILFQVINRHNVESEDSANIMNLKMAAFHPWWHLLFVQNLQRPNFLYLKYPKAICFLKSTFGCFLLKKHLPFPPFLSKT